MEWHRDQSANKCKQQPQYLLREVKLPLSELEEGLLGEPARAVGDEDVRGGSGQRGQRGNQRGSRLGAVHDVAALPTRDHT